MLAALLALALAAAGPGAHGRLSLSVNAGGGWASDVFLGAAAGAGALSELVPAARLDLSLSPRLKLRATGDVSWVRFFASGFSATGAAAGAELRLLGDPWELSLAARAEHAAFSSPAPLGGLTAAPEVTRSTGGLLVAAARRRAGTLLWRAEAGGTARRSAAAGADVWERGVVVAAGAEWRATDQVSVLVDARRDRIASARSEFASTTSGAAAGADLRPAGELDVSVRALLEWTRFDTGVRERFGRVAVELAHPAGPVTAVAAWSWSHSRVSGADVSGDRQLVLVAVRVGDRVLSW